MTPPGGYVVERAGRVSAVVREEAASWLREALAAGGTLHGWAGDRDDARTLSGRGTVYAVPAPVPGPDGRERWAVRHYRRGGMVAAPLLGDRYLAVGEPRPFRELEASAEARSRGVPTPAVVAGAVYPAGVFYRADLVTELVPGGVELAHALFGAGDQPEGSPTPWSARQALEAAAGLIGTLEEAGVEHPDLNARNVLLIPAGDGSPEAWALDLDRCVLHPPGRLPEPGRMARRLLRSVAKIAGAEGAPVPGEAADVLVAAGKEYGGGR